MSSVSSCSGCGPGSKIPATAFCFDPRCVGRNYLCPACENRHVGHDYAKLIELETTPLIRLNRKIEGTENRIVALGEYRRMLEGKELMIVGLVNRLKEDSMKMLQKIETLVNNCVREETDSYLAQMGRVSEKKSEVHNMLKKEREFKGLLEGKKSLLGAEARKSLADTIELYRGLLPDEREDINSEAAAEVSKEIGKLEYDYKANNKLLSLGGQFTERLIELAGGFDESRKMADYNAAVRPVQSQPDTYVYYIKENTNEICVYNLERGKYMKVQVEDWKAAKFMDSVQLGSRIYCSGGGMYLKSTYEYDYLSAANSMRRRSDMLLGKTLHKLVATLSQSQPLIFSLGGQGPESSLNTCEAFDPGSNSWSLIPPLNERKYGVAAVSFSAKSPILFCFGGVFVENGVEKFLSTIESLEISGSNSWKTVKTGSSPNLHPGIDMAAAQVSKAQIVVFGGFSGEFSYKSVVYDVNSGEISPFQSLASADSFRGTRAVMFSGKLCAIGYRRKDLHVFDLNLAGPKRRKWELMKAEEWMVEKRGELPGEEDSMILEERSLGVPLLRQGLIYDPAWP